ncbi:MAG: carboxypeptidase regulatory-like domain-containing protein, partial [Acidobacteria bacterium]|nr:carboxypeptidase regulatory-like domain-containing protein [Acidobacteriota bacterium]
MGHAALVIGLGLLAAVAAWAEGTTVTLGGQVRDLNGTGVAGVPVTLAGAQTGATVTDGDGRFAFAGLPAGGTYTVTPTGTAWSVAPVDQTVAGLTGDRVDLTFVA